MNVEEAWRFITDEITKNVEKFVPLIKEIRRDKPKDPWWSPALTREVKKKHKRWKEYCNNKTAENYKEYKKQRNKTTVKIRIARRQYEKNIIESMKKEPKKLYKYIRRKQKVKASVGPLQKDDGTLTETEGETAEVLHTFFQSVFITEEDDNIPGVASQVKEGTVLEDIELTPDIVYKELRNLNPNKAAGPDGVNPMVLKACARPLAKPISLLFRKTLDMRTLPEDWKIARVTPIFKKGGRKDANNYRPVSLTSQVCKIMERIIKHQVTMHLSDNELVNRHQHGFTQRKSCQTNLLETFNDWTKILDRGHSLDVVFLLP